jgi:hypothetical protein
MRRLTPLRRRNNRFRQFHNSRAPFLAKTSRYGHVRGMSGMVPASDVESITGERGVLTQRDNTFDVRVSIKAILPSLPSLSESPTAAHQTSGDSPWQTGPCARNPTRSRRLRYCYPFRCATRLLGPGRGESGLDMLLVQHQNFPGTPAREYAKTLRCWHRSR